jgi:hypothetical protein
MPSTKGTYFVALKAFVVGRFGQPGWADLLARLSPEEREKVDAAHTMSWYDMALRLRATHALQETVGPAAPGVLTDFGRFEAERDLSTTQRLFLRLASPAYAMEKAGQYWRRFYDWGELKVTREGKGKGTAEILGMPFSDAVYCTQFNAYMCRVFEMVGAKDVKATHIACRGRGDKTCLFEGSWRP